MDHPAVLLLAADRLLGPPGAAAAAADAGQAGAAVRAPDGRS